MRKITIITNDIFSDSPNNTSTIAMDGDITLNETSSNTSCDLDLLPTWLLKECVHQRLPLIKAGINRSKAKLVLPLCSKVATDNYLCRIIVPYLTFLSYPGSSNAIEEKIENNDPHDSYHSAYRRDHSTETVFLKVQQ